MTTTPTHPVTQASDEVEMQIRGLMMDPVTNMPIIVLKDVGSDLVLPIWVGIFEANAIALELEKTAMPRPMGVPYQTSPLQVIRYPKASWCWRRSRNRLLQYRQSRPARRDRRAGSWC